MTAGDAKTLVKWRAARRTAAEIEQALALGEAKIDWLEEERAYLRAQTDLLHAQTRREMEVTSHLASQHRALRDAADDAQRADIRRVHCLHVAKEVVTALGNLAYYTGMGAIRLEPEEARAMTTAMAAAQAVLANQRWGERVGTVVVPPSE